MQFPIVCQIKSKHTLLSYGYCHAICTALLKVTKVELVQSYR